MVLDMINMNVAAVKLAGGFDVRGAKHVYVIVNVAGVAANSSSTQADADAFQATIKSSNIQVRASRRTRHQLLLCQTMLQFC